MITTSVIEFIAILLILGIVSVVCVLSPYRVIRIISYWPKLLLKLFGDRIIGSRIGEILSLLEENPATYRQRFSKQLLILKVTGILGLSIVMLSICMLVFSCL